MIARLHNPLLTLLAVYIVADVLWPDYVAIILPGVPYITPPRVVLFLLIAAWLGAIATAPPVADRLRQRLGAVRWITVPLLVTVALKLAAIPLSPHRAMATTGLLNQGVTWYLPFLLAATLVRSRQNLIRGTQVFVVAASLIAVLVAGERFAQMNPYTATLGQLVTIDQPWIARIFRPQFRNGTQRAFGPFLTALSLGEFMTLCIPFALYWYEQARHRYTRVSLALCVLAMVYGTIAAQSRTAMLTSGFILGLHLIFRIGLVSDRRVPLTRRRLIAACGALGVLVAAGLGAMRWLNWQDALGHGGSRMIQLQLALPLLAARPIVGYGPGNGVAAEMLQYRNGGNLSIDSYYLTTGLETGFPGLLAFLVLLGAFLCLAYKRAAEPRADSALYLAFALFGTGFALIRTTLSQNENMNLFFIVLGAFVALYAMPPAAAGAAGPIPNR